MSCWRGWLHPTGPVRPPWSAFLVFEGWFRGWMGDGVLYLRTGRLTHTPPSNQLLLQSTSCAGAGSSRRTPPACCSTTAGRTSATCKAGSPSGTTASTRPFRSTDPDLACSLAVEALVGGMLRKRESKQQEFQGSIHWALPLSALPPLSRSRLLPCVAGWLAGWPAA